MRRVNFTTNYKIQEIVRLAKITGDWENPLFRRKVLRLDRRFNPERASRLIKRLKRKLPEECIRDHPFAPFPKENLEGDVYVGDIPHHTAPKRVGGRQTELAEERTYLPVPEKQFCLKFQEIAQHVFISGRSGAGKTNLIYNILGDLIREDIKFTIFDFKGDYLHLVRKYPGLLVFYPEDLRINPLDPQGVRLNTIKQALPDIIGGTFSLMTASRGYILHDLDYLYGKFKDKDFYPSLVDLHSLLEARKVRPGREAQYLDVLKNRLRTLTTALSPCVHCRRGFSLPELLLKNSVVIQMTGLTQDVQNFLTEYLMTYLFLHSLEQNRRGGLKHAIVLDEAKRIFDKNREKYAYSVPNISILTSRVREFGIGLIVADQEPSKIAESLLANTYAKIAFNCADNRDLYITARSFGLDIDQQKELSSLSVGEAVVKLADRVTEPFPIQVPYFDINKNISRKEVKAHMRPVLKKLMKHVVMVGRKDERETLSEDEELLLRDIYSRPFVPLISRYNTLSTRLSKSSADRAKKSLIKKGYVKEHVARSGARGGQIKLLKLTEKGAEYLNMSSPYAKLGEGSFLHRFWQNAVAESLRKRGLKARKSAKTNGKVVDIATEKDGRKTAFEITLSQDNIATNIKKDLAAGFDEVQLLFQTKKELQKAKSKVKKELGGRVPENIHFQTFSQVIEQV